MPGFIQITDTHIVAKGALANGRSDTAHGLSAAIRTINHLLPHVADVSCVIVTGDLTDHGTEQEYAHFRNLMRPLQLPWLAVPGNHDRRDLMRQALADMPWMPHDGPIQCLHDLDAFCVIGLDTLCEGSHHGTLSAQGFAFLDTALAAAAGRPVVVATHHPWVPSGIPYMDMHNLRNGATLMTRLAAYPGQVRMISGHVHRAITAVAQGITCQIAPSTCHAVTTNHGAGKDPSLILEPGAITLYTWASPDIDLISNTIPVGEFSGPWPFDDAS